MAVGLDDSVDKLVVTNVAAMRSKYGAGGLATVRAALRVMVEADGRRGVKTAIVDLGTPRGLPAGAAAITEVTDHELTRQAVDAVCDVAQPDYLVLLGAPDVVVHVPVANPMPAPDPDPDVPSDLPYACPGSPALEASALIGPKRVVGRLADVAGASGAAAARAFAATIRAAAGWTGADPDHYRHHLTLSTVRWQVSTGATAAALFGAGAAVLLAPPTAPPWSGERFSPPLHLVNLHGATADVRWLGDPGFAPALAAGDLVGDALQGVVVASECCSSAELFDPVLAGGSVPFANAYLAAGAYGLLGASCISYGGKSAPDAADVLCRYFVDELLAGASLGRALLRARQRYVTDQPVMTPIDLKTLAQFHLIGDPSVHPVTAPALGTRGSRRRNLEATGAALDRFTAVTSGAGQAVGADVARRVRGAVSMDVAARTIQRFEVSAADLGATALPAQRVYQGWRRRRSRDGTARVTIVEATEDASGLREHRVVERKDRA